MPPFVRGTSVAHRTEANRSRLHSATATFIHPSSTMTSRIRTSTYKGATVAVRWQELKRTDSSGSLFIAGYALTSEDGRATEWHQFDTPTFHTHDTAVAHALGKAHRFIDAQSPRNGTPLQGDLRGRPH